MIVRYVREREYKGPEKDPLLTLGKEYLALSIVANIEIDALKKEKRYLQICIQADDSQPTFFDLAYFEITDPRILGVWEFCNTPRGSYRLEPLKFGGNFWELFRSGDKEAQKTFEDVVQHIKVLHGWLVSAQ